MALAVERGLARTFAGHIHWRACGQGPVVMVSHINQQSSAVMAELLQALGAHSAPVAIDYPSHGHSDHIDWQPGIEDYARAVIETMDALGIERAAALGEAVGAAVSIALGGRWPKRIDKVVLVNTPYFIDAATAKSDIADIAKVRPSDESGFPRAALDRVPAQERSRACADAADPIVDGPHQTPRSSRSAATAGRRWARWRSSTPWAAWRRSNARC